MIRKIAYLSVVGLLISSIISCEKDFTDIGTNVIKNNEFSVKDTIIEVSINSKNIDAVIADNLKRNHNTYWLGVYNNSDYKKIEASIITQVGYITDPKLVKKTYKSDTTVVTKMDKVFLRIPYLSTKKGKESDGKPIFKIDSLLGTPETPTTLKVYQNETFLNRLDPNNPTKTNIYLTNNDYTKGALLNEDADFKFTIPQNSKTKDTIYIINRNLSTGKSFKDTLKFKNAAPFMVVPLDKNKIKSTLTDKFGGSEFANQVNFSEYFKGLIIEASGNDGVLAPFSFTGDSAPKLEIYYTNTLLKAGKVIDTLKRNITFSLNGIRNSKYVTSSNTGNTSNSFPIQGTAGNFGEINILNNAKIQKLKDKNWLINDASLFFYIDQSKDTTHVPKNLFLYKQDTNPEILGVQTPDIMVDGPDIFGGKLTLKNSKKDHYRFRITQYLADILDGKTTYRKLNLNAYNVTNKPTSPVDTVVTNYNWNPRGVWLYNGDSGNTSRKAILKISYTKKNN